MLDSQSSFRDLLASERRQLIATWERAFRRHQCWIENPPSQLQNVWTAKTHRERTDRIRWFHDRLGFKAKQTVERGGVCSGAIFRTRQFIVTPQAQRIGSKLGQTVHIEHTVPAGVLAEQLQQQAIAPGLNDAARLAWLLKHSVTTAFRKGQDRQFLKGVGKSTRAFDTTSHDDHGKPFQRYRKLFNEGEQVWNVWTGKEVDPSDVTFEKHLPLFLDIARAAGASPTFVMNLESAA